MEWRSVQRESSQNMEYRSMQREFSEDGVEKHAEFSKKNKHKWLRNI